MKKALFHFVVLAILAVAGHFIAYKIVHIPGQFEMVIIFALCIFYPVLRFPFFGVILLFFIMPFIPFLRRLYYLAYSRPSVDPLIIVGDIILVIMFIGLFFEFKDRRQQGKDGFNSISAVIMGYLIILVLRTVFFNILPLQDAFMRFRNYGPPVLLFFIGAFFAPKLKNLKIIWVITLSLGIFAALYGIKQLHFGYSEAEQLWFSSISFSTLFIRGTARPFSLFQAPAAFADYMQLSLIALIIILYWDTSPRRFLWVFSLPLIFYGTLITSVRSSWVGVAISLIIWITLIHVKTSRNRLFSISGLVIVFLVFTFASDKFTDGLTIANTSGSQAAATQIDLLVTQRVSAIASPFEEYSLLSRVALWKFMFLLARDPVMGILGRGVGALNADSLYVTYLAELGYPGMAFSIFITIFVIMRGFHLIDHARSRPVMAIARGITIMNIVWAVVNITGTHIHTFPGDAYFWFWNGILLKLDFSDCDDKAAHENLDNSRLPA